MPIPILKKSAGRLLFLLIAVSAQGAAQGATIAAFHFPEPFGVAHGEQMCEVPLTAPAFDFHTAKLVGPNGVTEVPYQSVDGFSKIVFPCHLPATTANSRFQGGSTNTTTDKIKMEGAFTIGYSFQEDTLVYITRDASACGLASGQNYFTTGYWVGDQNAGFKSTLAGPTIDLTANCSGGGTTMYVYYTGFIVDGATDTFTSPRHGFQNGDPYRCLGTHPTGLTCDGTTVEGYIINATANTFQVSATIGGAAINVGNLTGGLNKNVADFTWNLVDTGAPTAIPVNPIIVDRSNASYDQITNGITGVRIRKQAAATSWSVGAGTLTSVAVAPGCTFECITLNFPSPPGLQAGDVVTINGTTHPYGATGTWAITSVTNPTTFLIDNFTVGIETSVSPYNNASMTVTTGDYSYCPIQGIRLVDGTWLAGGCRLRMNTTNGNDTGGSIMGNIQGATTQRLAALGRGYTSKFTEAGALKTTIETTMTTFRPAYSVDPTPPYTNATAGTGNYTVKVTLFANSGAIYVEQSGDMNFAMFLDLYTAWPGTKPDRLNFITGASAQYTSISNDCGFYQPPPITGVSGAGTNPIVVTIPNHGMITSPHVTIAGIVSPGNINANVTNAAITVLDKDHFQIDSTTGTGTANAGLGSATIQAAQGNNNGHSTSYSMLIDYAHDIKVGGCTPGESRAALGVFGAFTTTAPVQYVYANSAGGSAPIVGLGGGSPATQVNSLANATGFYSSNNHFTTGTTALGIYALSQPTVVGQTIFTGTNNRQFEIYVGAKADIAAANPQTAPKIQKDLNRIHGIRLSSLYRYSLDYPDPAGGWINPWLPATSFNTIRSDYRNNAGGFQGQVLASNDDAAIRACWIANNSACIDDALLPGVTTTQDVMEALVNQFGVEDTGWAYVSFTYYTNPLTVTFLTMLADPNITADQKTALKRYLSLFGNLFLDYDNIPPYTYDGNIHFLNGDSASPNANQNAQVVSTQNRFISSLSSVVPSLASYRPQLLSNLQGAIDSAMNSYGSGHASPHYQGGNANNTYIGMLSQYNLAGLDIGNYPSVQQNSSWWIHTLTPPEARFGNHRMCPSWGDGNTEKCSQIGILATLTAPVNTTISRDSIAAWYSQQSTVSPFLLPYGTFSGTELVITDKTITPNTLALTSKNFPGYFSHLVHNYGTNNEHSIHILNSDEFYDHAHDQELSCFGYFFRAPWFQDISINVYQPNTPGRFAHCSMVFDSELRAAWDANDPNLYEPYTGSGASSSSLRFGAQAQTEFLAFTKSSCAFQTATAGGVVWTRKACLASPNAAYPIFRVDDSVSGSSAARTVTFPMLFDGNSVVTPAGSETPVSSWALRTTDCVAEQAGSQPTVYPGGGTTHSLPSGLQQFIFTGDTYTGMGNGGNGINMDIFSIRGTSGAQYRIHGFAHGCTGSIEGAEFQAANGRAYQERYAFLRFNDTGDFHNVFMPWLKNAAPTRTVTNPSANTVRSVQGSETTNISDTQFDYTDGTAKVLASYDANFHSAFNLTLTGGTQEIVMSNATAGVWTVTGKTAGTRCVDLSGFGGTWYASGAVTNPSPNKFCVYVPGGAQPTPVTIGLSTTAAARIQVNLAFRNTAADAVRVRFGSATDYMGLASCSTTCILSVLSPAGTQSFSYEYLLGGSVIGASAASNVVVQ